MHGGFDKFDESRGVKASALTFRGGVGELKKS